MNNLTKEQLSDLTARVNARLAEFGGMFEEAIPGVVRLTYDAIQEWTHEQAGDSWAELDTPPAPVAPPVMVSRMPVMVAPLTVHEPAYIIEPSPTNGNGHTEPALSPTTIATLGPEHTTVTPLRGRGGNVLPSLPELVAEVKRLSMGGTMPTMAVFDEARPATWARASAHLLRLGLTWESLAEAAGLKFVRRGSQTD